MYSLLIVFSNAVPGKDQAFNDWYTHVHIRDVMSLRGAIAVQRFRVSAEQLPDQSIGWGYLALYEACNVAKVVEGHAPAFTDLMPIANALDLTDPYDIFFDTVAYGCNQPDLCLYGDVIVDLVRGPLDATSLEAYRDACLSLLSQPGFISAQVMTRSSRQLMEIAADVYGHACLWRVSDRVQALQALAEHRRAHLRPNLTICCEPIIDRLEAGDVVHAMPQERAAADAFRRTLRPEDLWAGMPS